MYVRPLRDGISVETWVMGRGQRDQAKETGAGMEVPTEL